MPDLENREVRPGIQYQCHPDHRNGNREKSQWTISENEEAAVFINCVDSGWVQEHVGWGVHRPNGRVDYLGVDKTGHTRLIIARFVDENEVEIWHGFPADPTRKTERARRKEIPPEEIQLRWLNDQVLPAPKLRKIGRGEPCKL